MSPMSMSARRPRLASFVAFTATLLAAGVAAAQVDGGTTATTLAPEDFFIGVQHQQGSNLSDFDVARFFNKARCDCDETVYVYVTLLASGFAKRAGLTGATGGDNIEFWVGQTCSDINLRSQRCQPLNGTALLLSQFLPQGHITLTTNARVLSTYVNPGAIDVDGGTTTFDFPAGGNPTCTAPGLEFTQHLWVLVGTPGSYNTVVDRELRINLTPPPPPDSAFVTLEAGNEALVMGWQKLDTAIYNDLVGYQILCDRGGSLQVFSDGAFTPGFQTCPDTSAANGGGVAGLDPLFACSPLLTASATSYRVRILQNDIPYGVAVVADGQQRQREHARHLLRHAEQDQELLRRLPRRLHGEHGRPHAGGSGGGILRARVRAAGADAGAGGPGGPRVARLRGGPPAEAAMTGSGARRLAAAAGIAAGVAAVLAPGAARAQSFANETWNVEGDQSRYHSPQRFAFELRFGPYLPDVDGEFDGARHPYQDFFGSADQLMTQLELDYEFFHRFGSLGVGLGFNYFSVTGTSPVASGTGLPSGDQSTLKIFPLSLSAVYRFDYFLEMRRFPLVPFGKRGSTGPTGRSPTATARSRATDAAEAAAGGTPGWHVAGGLALVLDFVRSGGGPRLRLRPRREPHRDRVPVSVRANLGPRHERPPARRRHQLVARADARILSRKLRISSSTTARTSPAGNGSPVSARCRRRWRRRSAT